MGVGERFEDALARVAKALEAAGRGPDDATVVAVCKRQPMDRIIAAHDAGAVHLGESTAQGMVATAAALEKLGRDVHWHFVGRLQRNKVKYVVRHRCLVHGVDSLPLAEEISRRVGENEPIPILLQVNVGKEPQKGGVLADDAPTFAERLMDLSGIELRGLMTLPPAVGDPRPAFESLARLREQLAKDLPAGAMAELSMGMTRDYEHALAFGATLVRIGVGIFGAREDR